MGPEEQIGIGLIIVFVVGVSFLGWLLLGRH